VSGDSASSLLVSVAELSRHTEDPDWLVIDCRFDIGRPEAGQQTYCDGHIPGAIYAHLDRDLASPRTGASGRHPLPAADALARRFSDWGISARVQVVAYDDAGGAVAARLWWLLRWMGHSPVALLDGGWPAWIAAGLPVSKLPAQRPPAVFGGSPGHMPVIEAPAIQDRLRHGNLLLIDARARARYLGEMEPIDPVAGHVPGAVNVPFQTNLTPSGTFCDPGRLRTTMQPLLAGRRGDDVAVMCGSGVTACHVLFAMELAGLPGARLYPGSWSEWIADPGRPVARG
jgi:thiosulfate/3-mercaptopyruvate sulfurtransferase